MKKIIMLFCLTLVSNLSFAKSETWIIDADHTKIAFSISHLIISTVDGSFRSSQGNISFDTENTKKNLGNFKIDINIDTKSIDTGNQKRDDHLRGKDFFDVVKYPSITFNSERVESKDGKKFNIHGVLTMAGKSKKIILNTLYIGLVSAYDVKRIAFKAFTKIKREDFGLTWNDVVESGPVIGSDIEISINVEAKRKADLI